MTQLHAVSLAGIWTVMAVRAGMFIPHDDRWAVRPGEFSPDVMATHKRIVTVGGRQVAYVEMGQGEPVILLHGCPFSVYEWSKVAPELAKRYRVIAPDLIGLGDTPVRLDEDYRLPQDVKMVQALMDHLGIRSARFIGHDHGGAIVQLLMQHDPGRIDSAILSNVEAYDQWPSKPEIPDLKLITNPVTSPLIHQAFQFRPLQRELYSTAVADRATLTDETLDGFTKQHLTSPERWQRLRRFLSWQLDADHNRLTMEAVPAMRRFEKPVLILWGRKDTNSGPEIAERLAKDIPGAVGIQWMERSAHMPMLEEPEAYSSAAVKFFGRGGLDKPHPPRPRRPARRRASSARVFAQPALHRPQHRPPTFATSARGSIAASATPPCQSRERRARAYSGRMAPWSVPKPASHLPFRRRCTARAASAVSSASSRCENERIASSVAVLRKPSPASARTTVEVNPRPRRRPGC